MINSPRTSKRQPRLIQRSQRFRRRRGIMSLSRTAGRGRRWTVRSTTKLRCRPDDQQRRERRNSSSSNNNNNRRRRRPALLRQQTATTSKAADLPTKTRVINYHRRAAAVPAAAQSLPVRCTFRLKDWRSGRQQPVPEPHLIRDITLIITWLIRTVSATPTAEEAAAAEEVVVAEASTATLAAPVVCFAPSLGHTASATCKVTRPARSIPSPTVRVLWSATEWRQRRRQLITALIEPKHLAFGRAITANMERRQLPQRLAHQLAYPPQPKRRPAPNSTPKPLGADTPDTADAFPSRTDTPDWAQHPASPAWASPSR